METEIVTWKDSHKTECSNSTTKHEHTRMTHCKNSGNEESLVTKLGHDNNRQWCNECMNKTRVNYSCWRWTWILNTQQFPDYQHFSQRNDQILNHLGLPVRNWKEQISIKSWSKSTSKQQWMRWYIPLSYSIDCTDNDNHTYIYTFPQAQNLIFSAVLHNVFRSPQERIGSAKHSKWNCPSIAYNTLRTHRRLCYGTFWF